MYQNSKVHKHGVCVIHYNRELKPSTGILNGKTYLCTAADLATEHNMGQYLKDFKLGNEYTVGDLSDAIKNQIKVVPEIVSFKDESERYLESINLYFNKDLKLIDNKKPEEDRTMKVKYLPCNGNVIALDLPQHNIKQ